MDPAEEEDEERVEDDVEDDDLAPLLDFKSKGRTQKKEKTWFSVGDRRGQSQRGKKRKIDAGRNGRACSFLVLYQMPCLFIRRKLLDILRSSSSLSLKCALRESGCRICYELTRMSRYHFWRTISTDINVEVSALSCILR